MIQEKSIKERPILFSSPMVPAVLEGRKTQTRRVVKFPDGSQFEEISIPWMRPTVWLPKKQKSVLIDCPYGKPGDQLWVREAWHAGACADVFKPSELSARFWKHDNGGLWYPATDTKPLKPVSPMGRYRYARFMPRWASRIQLEITGIRAERLQDITEEDAIAEGCEPEEIKASEVMAMEPCQERDLARLMVGGCLSPKFIYSMLWDEINGDGAWNTNPWVWVVSFKRIKP